jgi:DNA-binding beta-propeller fold protein YncE
VWRTWGGYGAGLGQFIGPTDVGIDAGTNLYVADLYNDRVQRMNAAGTWSVFITNGAANGRVIAPKNLLVETNGFYVSDADTRPEGKSRIQKFGTNGQFQALLGTDQPVEGGLKWPGGMSRWGGDLYVADSGNNRVVVTPGTNMAWTTLIGGGTLNGPQDVVWDPRGILYVADTLNHRILVLPLMNGATNSPVEFTSMTAPGSDSVVISWFGRLNWYYAIQYVDSLGPDSLWHILPGCTNIVGRDADTNCTDGTVSGTLNRFYRIISY